MRAWPRVQGGEAWGERFAEACKASASQPIETFNRFGDDSLKWRVDKPNWIRKRQLHFQSMPVRGQKSAEAHMPVSRSLNGQPRVHKGILKWDWRTLCVRRAAIEVIGL